MARGVDLQDDFSVLVTPAQETGEVSTLILEPASEELTVQTSVLFVGGDQPAFVDKGRFLVGLVVGINAPKVVSLRF